MAERIQVVVEASEREAFRAQARAEGRSLSDWLREAGRQRLSDRSPADLSDPVALANFFAECDAAEGDVAEPDWASHLTVIDASRREGLAAS